MLVEKHWIIQIEEYIFNTMNKIEVVTSITGGKDNLNHDQVTGNAIFTVYSDVEIPSTTWKCKKAYDNFKDQRRNSRIPKILIHKFSDADITIWMDGNMKLLVSPEVLVEKYLQDYDMAIFAHGMRDCIYDEAMTCAKLRLDDPEIIIEQAKYYEDNEYGKHKGLCEGGFIIRRNNARTKAFNEAWWADYCRFSRRDQLSLMPAMVSSRVRVNIINERWVMNPIGLNSALREDGMVQIFSHQNFEGNFNDPNLKT